jgi:KDO2-lipid IV(A) lauroyltransferase
VAPFDGSKRAQLGAEALFWRRLAKLGATRFPRWWLHWSPPFFGLAAAALVPSARRAVASNLLRARGPAGRVRTAVDVARTFVTYAGALAEGLASGSPNARQPEALVFGEEHIVEAIRRGRGAIFATAHTAGWEIVGPLLSRDHGLRVMMAMQAERDAGARDLHDGSRRARGLEVVHVGDDPLASLTLLSHVRGGGVAALQLDRVPLGIRARTVRLFGEEGRVPEGPLRLAQLARAPILPVFCAREGFERYVIDIGAPIDLPPRPTPAELDAAAQRIADAMTRFLRAHPTQWLMFR